MHPKRLSDCRKDCGKFLVECRLAKPRAGLDLANLMSPAFIFIRTTVVGVRVYVSHSFV